MERKKIFTKVIELLSIQQLFFYCNSSFILPIATNLHYSTWKKKSHLRFWGKVLIAVLIVFGFLYSPTVISFPYNLAGIVPLIGGAYIAITTKSVFRRIQLPSNHRRVPVKLLTQGFFNISRNPVYLGIAIAIGGVAILTGVIYNLIFPVIYLLIIDRYFVKDEEKDLEMVFGEEYRNYKLKTKRWL